MRRAGLSSFVIWTVFCTAFGTLAAAEPSWTEFRGPNGIGKAPQSNPPTDIGEGQHVRWKTAVAGKAWSSPVVLDGQVWITNAPEDGKKLSAVCLDFETGRVLHDVLVFDNPEPQFCHPLNSYGTPTPVLEKGRVYVHFGVHGTACLDSATGRLLWSRRDLPCNHFRGPASSPILYGDLLVVCFDGFDQQYVVALRKSDGTTAWKHDRAFDFKVSSGDNKKAYGTPSVIEVGGKPLLVCPAAVATEAFEPVSGRLVWTVFHGGMNAAARPLYGDGLLYLTNGMGRLVALKPEGEGDITKSIVWESSKGTPKKASPLLEDGLLYMFSDAGVLTCADAKTGESIWSQRIEGDSAASPVLASGRIYVFGMNGPFAVMAAGREPKILASGTLESGCMASPALVGDSLVVRTKTHVYRFAK